MFELVISHAACSRGFDIPTTPYIVPKNEVGHYLRKAKYAANAA